MRTEILCVGTELLLGDIVNTNASFIAKQLSSIGIDIYHHSVVGDNHDRLKKAIEIAFSRSDLIVTTGGLGPTFDDITKFTIASYFGKELVHDETAIKNIKNLFKSLDREMTDNNLRQALVIDGCTVLDNENGLAPGMYYSDGKKTVVMLPGPPSEMKPMVLNKLMPILSDDSDSVLLSKNVHIFGVGESKVESILHEKMVSSTNPTIAPYAKQNEMFVRVTAKAENEQECISLIDPIVDEIKDIFGNNVYGVDVPNIQTQLISELNEKNLTISVAESCTGGLLGSKLTEISGSSKSFLGGMITYSNDIKIEGLGVEKQTIIDYGAVSEQTAYEMAKKISEKTGSDIGVSITGIAGPNGGTEDKPVGLVYVGINHKGKIQTHKLQLSRGRADERNSIRNIAAANAMFLVLCALKDTL